MENVTLNKMTGERGFIYLILFGITTAIAWQFPEGRLILYPFTILGTWFHEMGHGFSALLLGGNFIRLDIFPDGSGLAAHSGSSYLGNIGRALIAAGGPVGPTIAGSVFIIASKKEKPAKLILLLLSFILIVSAILWIRTFFGLSIIIAFGLITGLIALKGKPSLQKASLQFLGIQAFMSLYLSINYLFSKGGVVDGKAFNSDTQVMADNLLLPFWFWGGLIILLSLFLIYLSLKKVFMAPQKK